MGEHFGNRRGVKDGDAPGKSPKERREGGGQVAEERRVRSFESNPDGFLGLRCEPEHAGNGGETLALEEGSSGT